MLVLVLAGCGVPQELSKQAEGVHSVAAEGALLAHEASEGSLELTPRTLKITGLVVGELGLLERLGLGAPTSSAELRTRDVIPWKDVIRADRRGVVVRDGARPETTPS